MNSSFILISDWNSSIISTMKMNVNKVKIFCAFLLLSTFLVNENDCITIEIHPDELEQIGEILVQSYMQLPTTTTRSGIPRRAAIIAIVKKTSSSVLQLFAILITLVGANLLTTKLEPFASNRIVEVVNTTTPTNTDIPALLQNCEPDFGCSDNKCWRTCDLDDHEKTEENSWCYTTPNPNEKDYHRCIFALECSPCWICVTPCQK